VGYYCKRELLIHNLPRGLKEKPK